MIVSELFPQASSIGPLAEKEVSGISRDSRILHTGEVFFVISGEAFDIFNVLKTIESKVLLFVAARKDKEKMAASVSNQAHVLYVDDVQAEFRRAVNTFYAIDWGRFGFIGATGTNGKTTTTHIIYQLIRCFDLPASLMGTVQYCMDGIFEPAFYTTPDYLRLHQLLASIREDDIRYIVMEVSSHALTQERVAGIPFRRCIFTNLSHDHLDYHNTMDEYFKVKSSFFSKNPQSLAVLNIDDPYGRKLAAKISHKKITYSLNNTADFIARDIRLYPGGTDFILQLNQKEFPVRTRLIGAYNALNILAALATLYSYGFNIKDAIHFLREIPAPCGRMEQVALGVYVDYAHTPDALEKSIMTLRCSGYKNVICVFGCGGDRDRTKRPLMGKIATAGADESIITSDNPRTEDPDEICKQIEQGCKNNYSIIIDRAQAIEAALKKQHNCNDTAVLIAGKGHEEYQIIGTKRYPFKDQEVVKCLKQK